MTGDRLFQIQRDLGWGKSVATFIPEINFPEYALPTRKWIVDKFAPALKFDLEMCGLNVYQDLKNICVMFAKAAVFFAWTSNKLTLGQPLPLLWGDIGYMKQQPDSIPNGHRINFTFVEEDGKEVPIFFEPQNQTIVELSDEEILSIHKTEA